MNESIVCFMNFGERGENSSSNKQLSIDLNGDTEKGFGRSKRYRDDGEVRFLPHPPTN